MSLQKHFRAVPFCLLGLLFIGWAPTGRAASWHPWPFIGQTILTGGSLINAIVSWRPEWQR